MHELVISGTAFSICVSVIPESGVVLLSYRSSVINLTDYLYFEFFGEFPSLHAHDMNPPFNGYILSYLAVHFKGFILKNHS
jgi:hypothetical protein